MGVTYPSGGGVTNAGTEGYVVQVDENGDLQNAFLTSQMPIRVVTTTVQTNVGTKQNLLSVVPVGKKRIPVRYVVRNTSADLSAIADALNFGFNAGATNAGQMSVDDLTALNNATKASAVDTATAASGIGSTISTGAAGDVLGCIFLDDSVTATVDIDVHYYDVDA